MSSPSHFYKCTSNLQCPYKASIPPPLLNLLPSYSQTLVKPFSPLHHRHTSSHLSPLTLIPPISTHTLPTYLHSHSPHLSPLTLSPPISTHTHPTYLHSHSSHLSPLTLTPPISTHTHPTMVQFPLTLSRVRFTTSSPSTITSPDPPSPLSSSLSGTKVELQL